MSSLPKLSPMDLLQVSAPFDDPDLLSEVKFDGFRALGYVENGTCELVSRKGHTKNVPRSSGIHMKWVADSTGTAQPSE